MCVCVCGNEYICVYLFFGIHTRISTIYLYKSL